MAEMAMEETMAKVLNGTCPFNSLPPLNKKVVRIFVSSTFSDTKEERNALMRNVYPRLAEYCRDRFGLEFQVVDMRWGVPEHASDHHTTSQLCIDEIKKCQEVSVGPNFVTLLGHKYGYRPLPNTIDQDVFDALTKAAEEAEDPLWGTVKTWYLKDVNNHPPTYVLQSIGIVITEYNNTEDAEARQKAQQVWWTAEKDLITSLRGNATNAHESGLITPQQKHLFFMSVTENEVIHGILEGKTDPKNSVVAIMRNIPDIEHYLDDQQAPRFADTIPSQAKLDEEAASHLTELRDRQLQSKIPDENITRVEVEWLACGANISEDTVKDVAIAKFEQKFGKSWEINISTHRRYLKAMCTDFQKRIIHLINEGGEKNIKSYDELTTELLQHQHLAKTRCEVFEGREDVMQQVQAYLKDASTLPLIIYGHSGCGKTSVISRIYEILCATEGVNTDGEAAADGIVTIDEADNTAIDSGDSTVSIGSAKENVPTQENAVDVNATSEGGDKNGARVLNHSQNPDDSAAHSNQKVKENKSIWKKKGKTSDKDSPSTSILLRFLGTTPFTTTIQQVLVTACRQIARIYGLKWTEPDKFTDISRSFKELLKNATKNKPIILLLDSIDQLMPVYGAYKVDWLPKTLPPHVKVVLSTLVEDYPVYKNLRKRYEESGSKFIEILPLGDEVGMTIIKRWLENSNRTITEEQEIIVRKALTICSLPLYARITYSHVMRWASYYQPDNDILAATVQEAISTMFQQMETKLGAPLVKHSLALLTASRYGLSEVELEHTLSLDDDFLAHIYKFWKPPIRRVPPLLWTRVRNEISNYIVERSVDGILVMYWYHRQFIAATKARYLADPQFLNYVHTILSEYFMGRWSNGKQKPFEYTEHQRKRFTLDNTKSSEDRKVPSQPFIYDSQLDSQSTVRFNQRKISELPLHLFKSRQQDVLLKEIFFNYEWIYAKIKISSPRALLQEYELFMLSDKKLMKNIQLKLLVANLQLSRPFVAKVPECLPLEITGRLVKFIGRHPLITTLIEQCDTKGIQQCPLSPVMTCYETADVGLKQNIHIRDTDPWHEGGAITCTSNFKSMYLIDYSMEGEAHFTQWDIKSGDKISDKILPKMQGDVYFHIVLDKSEKKLIAFYKKHGHVRNLNKKVGYIDIINVDTSEVEKTYECPLQKADFYNSLQFITENWVCARFGRQMPMFAIHGESREIPLKTPNYLTQNEELQVTLHPKLPNITMQDGKPVRLENTRHRMGEIKKFKRNTHKADMEKSEEAIGVGIAPRDRTVALIDLKGHVMLHDLEHVRHPRKVKKVKRNIYLPVVEHVNSIDIHTDDVFDAYHQQVVEGVVIFSPDEKYLISVYQSAWRSKWEAFLWNLTTLQFVRRLANNRSNKLRLPVFTADSKFVVMTSLDMKQVRLISCESGQPIKTYDVGHVIRDFVASPKSTQIALLLQKDIMFVDANPEELLQGTHVKEEEGPDDQEEDIELLPRERIDSHHTHPRLLIQSGKTAEEMAVMKKVEEKDRLRRGGSAGSRPGSASSIRHLAIDTWETPDGEKLVQLHSRAQVIDTKEEAIKYTPHGEDKVVFSKTELDDQQETWDAYTGQIDLETSDRIIAIGNKTKYKVTYPDPGRIKIMCVPSVIRISVMQTKAAKKSKLKGAAADMEAAKPKEKLKTLLKITIFQENIATVSQNYIVTVKKTWAGEYINVYDIETGKFVTFPGPNGGFGCARISLDEKQMFLATKNREMKIYPTSSPHTTPPITILPDKSSSQKCIIHDILTFPGNPQCVIMRYAKEGPDAHFNSSYRYVSLEECAMSKPLNVSPALDDVSWDGLMGIGNDLRIYNMVTGEVEKRIEYTSGDSQPHIQARISDDKTIVVFVDLGDDTLHVYDVTRDVHVVTCFKHSRQWATYESLRVRQNGRVITVSGPVTGVFVLRDPREAERVTTHPAGYGSDVIRARALMEKHQATRAPPVRNVPQIRLLREKTAPLPPIARLKPVLMKKTDVPIISTAVVMPDRGPTPAPILPPIVSKEKLKKK